MCCWDSTHCSKSIRNANTNLPKTCFVITTWGQDAVGGTGTPIWRIRKQAHIQIQIQMKIQIQKTNTKTNSNTEKNKSAMLSLFHHDHVGPRRGGRTHVGPHRGTPDLQCTCHSTPFIHVQIFRLKYCDSFPPVMSGSNRALADQSRRWRHNIVDIVDIDTAPKTPCITILCFLNRSDSYKIVQLTTNQLRIFC